MTDFHLQQSQGASDFDLTDFLNFDEIAAAAPNTPLPGPSVFSGKEVTSSSSTDPLFGDYGSLSFYPNTNSEMLREDSPLLTQTSPVNPTWSPSRFSAPSATPPLAPPAVAVPTAEITPELLLQAFSLFAQRQQPQQMQPDNNAAFQLTPQHLQTLNQLMTVAALSAAAQTSVVNPADLTSQLSTLPTLGNALIAQSASALSQSPESKLKKLQAQRQFSAEQDSSDSDNDGSSSASQPPKTMAPKKPPSNSKHAPSKDHTTGEEVIIDKSLSSRERRQLRNKISARNFRLRRKEYITTLEDELKKVNDDNSDLKERVAILERENTELRREVETLRSSSVEQDVKPTPAMLSNDGLSASQRNLLNMLQSLQKPGYEAPSAPITPMTIDPSALPGNLLSMLNLVAGLNSAAAPSYPTPVSDPLLPAVTSTSTGYDPMDEDWMNRFNKDVTSTSSSSSSSSSKWAGGMDRRVRVHHVEIPGLSGGWLKQQKKVETEDANDEVRRKLVEGAMKAAEGKDVVVRTAMVLGLYELARRRGVKVVVE